MGRLFRAGLLPAALVALASAQSVLLSDTFTSYDPTLFLVGGYTCASASTPLSSCATYAPTEDGIIGSTTAEFLRLTPATDYSIGSIESRQMLPLAYGAYVHELTVLARAAACCCCLSEAARLHAVLLWGHVSALCDATSSLPTPTIPRPLARLLR